ncbi:hypothetical protein [Staphylospora marina]|uniref:hypothetical protein n=1 Tax=Staphylospora marina TaxID=2490858 RepID=UPI000F5BE275|nr:hypothetical protein [Staphylospora marina]
MKSAGDMIGGCFKVIQSFPFVIGTLYFAEEAVSGQTRSCFIHALSERVAGKLPDPEAVIRRDASVFFPIRKVFVEDGTLYQVFDRLSGTLLAYRLERESFRVPEAAALGRKVCSRVLSLYARGEFALVHPQNMLLLPKGNIRFLYGGKQGVLPKQPGLFMDTNAKSRRLEEQIDVFMLGAMVYRMITGRNPVSTGLKVPRASRFRPDIPREMDDLLDEALSASPEKRPELSRMEAVFGRFSASPFQKGG